MAIDIKCLDDTTLALTVEQVENFKMALRGELLTPRDENYEVARQIWNKMIDRRPALIAQCSGTADVITAMRFAIEHDLLFSVKGGGHNIAGSAVCEGGLMIDLGAMNGVRVDPVNKTASVQAGALLGDIDHETQAFGLAVTTGINSTTGIGGLALGGGLGWLSRAFGHTIDSMLSADIVTATGEFLHVSETENADLFWAIRGGSGNFGIVTNFEFRLHELGPMVMSGPVVYPLENASDVLRKYREIEPNLPDEASVWLIVRKAPPLPFLDPKEHGRPVLILAMFYAGDMAEGEKVLAPFRNFGGAIGDGVAPHPYAGWQQAFDGLVAPRARNYWKSSDFTELHDEVIETLVDAVAAMPGDEFEVAVAHVGGVAGRVADDATAFPHRQTKFTMNIHGRWQDSEMDAVGTAWVREVYEQSKTKSTGGVYVNFVPENGEVRKIGTYGVNQTRLETIKAKYDPKNRFRSNINILPKPNT